MIKKGDLVECLYTNDVSVAYGNIIKITNSLGEELDYCDGLWQTETMTYVIKIVGYQMMGNSYTLYDDIIEWDDTISLRGNHIVKKVDEDYLNQLISHWYNMVEDKKNFLYKNINKDNISGKKIIKPLKF